MDNTLNKIFNGADYQFPYMAEQAAMDWANKQTEPAVAVVIWDNKNNNEVSFYYSPACISDSDTILLYLISLLNRHDWTYQYSDDHRYWLAGDRSWRRIEATVTAADKLGLGDTARNILKIKSEENKGGVPPLHVDQLENIFSKD